MDAKRTKLENDYRDACVEYRRMNVAADRAWQYLDARRAELGIEVNAQNGPNESAERCRDVELDARWKAAWETEGARARAHKRWWQAMRELTDDVEQR